MSDFTTLQVEKETRDKLKKLKVAKLETYNEIILRLIKEHEEKED